MTPKSFIADSAAAAVSQIRQELGPEAVVIHVRKLQADGISRLWQKAKIEVIAYKPDPAESAPKQPEVPILNPNLTLTTPIPAATALPEPRHFENEKWKAASILQESGILPQNVQRILDIVKQKHGDYPPAELGEELAIIKKCLAGLWRPSVASSLCGPQPHILIGPAGSGKSVVLAKWLTQTVLIEGGQAKVWRLDGLTANTAESLSVYCEILGLEAQRTWTGQSAVDIQAMQFIDLPGIAWQNKAALNDLDQLLRQFGMPRLHLVLNAAYELPIMMAQVRAFSGFALEDIIVGHLDEETRWGKLWNLVLGTNVPIRFTSAGQNIPGDLLPATAEALLARQFRSKG
ncbi:MAG: flagellar biosynthesis protein FlhF [Verrucomicrobiales bacterium]|nr:flagellar biosynthesis protein FlhF [Verrucomicrobiales bacterium]